MAAVSMHTHSDCATCSNTLISMLIISCVCFLVLLSLVACKKEMSVVLLALEVTA